MDLPAEKNAYVTIAILEMPFRVQKYGPYGEDYQNIWQQVMERLDQLQVVGWGVCWARVVDKPTNLAIIVYHPKHHSKKGPEHDTLFFNNILQPLLETIGQKPRYINLELDIPSAAGFTNPDNGLTKLFFLDIITDNVRHTNMTPRLFDDPRTLIDPVSTLPITSFIPEQPPRSVIPSRNKNYDMRTMRRGVYFPPDAHTFPNNIKHELLSIEFSSKKASLRFQDPTKPCTGLSMPDRIQHDGWNTEFLQPLQELQDAGIVLRAERLILEQFAWPMVKTAHKIEKEYKEKDLPMFDLTGVDEARKDVEKRMGWLDRAISALRPSKKTKHIVDDDRSDGSGGIDEIEEVIEWVKTRSRTDSGYSSGNYATITTVETTRLSEEENTENAHERLKRSSSMLERRRREPIMRNTISFSASG